MGFTHDFSHLRFPKVKYLQNFDGKLRENNFLVETDGSNCWYVWTPQKNILRIFLDIFFGKDPFLSSYSIQNQIRDLSKYISFFYVPCLGLSQQLPVLCVFAIFLSLLIPVQPNRCTGSFFCFRLMCSFRTGVGDHSSRQFSLLCVSY